MSSFYSLLFKWRQTTLFDPLLMTPLDTVLPVSYDLGAGDLLLLWLCEAPETWLLAAQQLVQSREGLRVLLARPSGAWKDQAIVQRGMEWFEMHEMPTEEVGRRFSFTLRFKRCS